jgi:hypothetical protein
MYFKEAQITFKKRKKINRLSRSYKRGEKYEKFFSLLIPAVKYTRFYLKCV